MTDPQVKQMGVDQIKKVLDVIIEAGNVSEKVASADSIIGKAMALMPIADDLLRLMSLSPMVLRREWSDLDDAERKELIEYVREKLDISDDDLEARVEVGLELVNDAIVFIDNAMDYAKSFKSGGDA